MLELARYLTDDREFKALLNEVRPGRHDGLITGLSGSSRHVAFASMVLHYRDEGRTAPLVVVTHTANQAEQTYDDLVELLPDETIVLFPEQDLTVVDALAYSTDVTSLRIQALEKLSHGVPRVLVTTIAALSEPIMTKSMFLTAEVEFEVGTSMPMDDAMESLLRAGYERVDLVETRGQISRRGGILDIYPLTSEHPYRIEWFDTDVDSIRSFDLASQRSLDKLTELKVGPAYDLLIPRHQMIDAAGEVQSHLEKRLRTVTDLELKDRLQSSVGGDIRKLQSGFPFVGQIRYANLFGKHVTTLSDYIPNGSTVCLDEPTRLQERERALEKEYSEWLSGALMRGDLISGTALMPAYHSVWENQAYGRVQFSMFSRAAGTGRLGAILNITAKTMQTFHGQMNVLKTEVTRWQKAGMTIVMVASTPERAERLLRVLEDYRIPGELSDRVLRASHPQVVVGSLSQGFELPMHRLAVVMETEVFTNRKKARKSRVDMSDAERIKSYQELKPGDYVVHINHGIGKYIGIRTLEIEGRHKDYLHLTYAGNDSLYVPVEQIDQVQRYVGSEEKEPKVYHLGGSDWQRVKSRVSKTVRDIAEDLVKLYAERESRPGHAFSGDTPWQKDFEDLFPYNETPDQLRAVQDIKRDMERSRPMDRLLCGDVGYGKTEVAVRAAFKAVMDGKQVALLVPTTVLAQQHYETFKERFAGFPVTIDMLSRFRSRTESQACIKGLKDGSVDVVIGTHRLLQKSMQFKDLGLLIVDEEQRFGVTHKERLKQLRANVDCLTLTATPIPRTLHMSMIGVRDLSVIETPPENRFPVQTYVVEFNEGMIREAIERELNRGGQVYFVYNQVQSIRSMADRIAGLVPEARIEVAHGQMAEDELERVMLNFLEGETDILVTTTIIETGLDISNVNTLIVNDADRLGLSQLYQLRGRVGRSNRIAYSYFMYQKDKVLTEVAEKRLQAIKEFTELGSGFKIAMRDLSIRGAGNLLGAEQHGFINSVGFDMYTEMLMQAVKELRGEKQEEAVEPSIELPIEAYLPDSYIPDTAQKIAMYKKFKYVRSLEAADDVEDELLDRFGDIPAEVKNLLDITRVKALAMNTGIDSVSQQGAETSLRFPTESRSKMDYTKLLQLSMKHAGQSTTRPNGTFFVSFRTKGKSDQVVLKLLIDFLSDYDRALHASKEAEEYAN